MPVQMLEAHRRSRPAMRDQWRYPAEVNRFDVMVVERPGVLTKGLACPFEHDDARRGSL